MSDDDQALLADGNSHYSAAQIEQMPAMPKITDRQKQYIWLLGSFPQKIGIQGRGYRTERLMFGLTEDEIVFFGYSFPLEFLSRRGLVRKLQNAQAYVLTTEGEIVFQQLLVRGEGMTLNRKIRQVAVK